MAGRTADSSGEAAPVRIGLVGVGQHAESSLLPAIARQVAAGQAELVVAVDVDRVGATRRVAAAGLDAEVLAPAGPFSSYGNLSRAAQELLDAAHLKHQLDLVLVATPPEAHLAYAVWAMESGCHLMIDKPVSARPCSTSQEAAAWGYVEDWETLVALRHLHPDLIVAVNAHRRVEPGYLLPLAWLRECATAPGQSLHKLRIEHGDGQWRTPHELTQHLSHGFLLGAGKLVHSGYHFLDLMACALAAGFRPDDRPDEARVTARLTLPGDHLRMVPADVRDAILAAAEDDLDFDFDDPSLGEIDADLTVEIFREHRRVAICSMGLSHTSLSQRIWGDLRGNTYRRMGRVRHISVLFEQGTVQRVGIESHQARQPTDEQLLDDFEVGGRNHLDMTRWQSAGLGPPEPRVVSARELPGYSGAAQLLHDDVKSQLVELVVGAIQDPARRGAPELRYTDITEHGGAPHLLAAAYLSHQREQQGADPRVTVPLVLPTTREPHVLPPVGAAA